MRAYETKLTLSTNIRMKTIFHSHKDDSQRSLDRQADLIQHMNELQD